MLRIAIVPLMVVAVLLAPCFCPASDKGLETSHLMVSDATGTLSNEHLGRLADFAQETLNRIIAFWSADPGIARSGKIGLIFDAPRRDVYSSVFYWDSKGDRRIRIVLVFGTDGEPQMMAHKLWNQKNETVPTALPRRESTMAGRVRNGSA
jgi:hypothetical protein